MTIEYLFMLVGFIFAAYSIVANDSIQTLGTFLASNHMRKWWVLWIYVSGIATVVLIYGWWTNGGDPSYGRLAKFPYEGPSSFSWIVIIPPLALLFLTKKGYPVSTTFLILTFFSPKNLQDMLIKSLSGYAVAFVAGFVIFYLVSKVAAHYLNKDEKTPQYWVVLQWCSTAFLWSQWLIQDLANIYVYLPRPLPVGFLIFGLITMVLLQGLMLKQKGGKIQKIVTSKSGIQNIRSATIVDFVYAIIILVFKDMSQIPMSTTWVFLGLLAGRETAIAMVTHLRTGKKVQKMIWKDGSKALVGLGVSVLLALGLPQLHDWINSLFS